MRQLSFVLMLCLVGCGSSEKFPALPLYPVSGTLKIDGKPAEAVTIILFPVKEDSRAKPAMAITDKDGNFKLRTNGDRGVALGSYKVVLGGGKQEVITGSTPEAELKRVHQQQDILAKAKGKMDRKKGDFPVEWGAATTSPKTYEVTTSPPPLNIDI